MTSGNEVPNKAKQAREAVAGLLVLVVCGWLVVQCTSDSPGELQKKAEAKALADAVCKTDLQCAGEKGLVSAGVYCPKHVEQLAKHAVKWTDSTLDIKFTHYRWRDKASGTVTHIGDKVEFQNGFGAFTPMIYECDMAFGKSEVLNVRVREGRLPIS